MDTVLKNCAGVNSVPTFASVISVDALRKRVSEGLNDDGCSIGGDNFMGLLDQIP